MPICLQLHFTEHNHSLPGDIHKHNGCWRNVELPQNPQRHISKCLNTLWLQYKVWLGLGNRTCIDSDYSVHVVPTFSVVLLTGLLSVTAGEPAERFLQRTSLRQKK